MANSNRDDYFVQTKRKLIPNRWDIIALLFGFSLLGALAWNAKQMALPYHLGQALPISLNSYDLLGYALQTILRMAIALVFSLLFTFIIAPIAAKNKQAEKLIIPLIDLLQSVPVLAFLSITVAGFIALFPGSLIGPECAAIFAIFTSQVWNMTLSMYQSLKTVPADLREAAAMFQLSSWQRFWRLEVPYAMPGLLWNTMMSMSAGWFFVVASEAISVANQNIMLPGVGSYIALAIKHADLKAVGFAIMTMLLVILLYDQLLFRPLVKWAEKFKFDDTPSEAPNMSWVFSVLNRTRLLVYLSEAFSDLTDFIINNRFCRRKVPTFFEEQVSVRHKVINFIWNAILVLLVLAALVWLYHFVSASLSIHEFTHVVFLGACTALRVFILIALCSLIWVPIGVKIGLHPRLAQIVQPLAQIGAAFPANLLFPMLVFLIVRFNLNVNIWTTPLMILGSQWYILFNVIVGTSMLPRDLYHVADNLGLKGWLWWRRFILPGIFPYYITGAITAAGGAWNASIVAEFVSWGHKTLIATGLGAYITEFTTKGNFPHIVLGTAVMCLYVLLFNRILWQPLYNLAARRFRLE